MKRNITFCLFFGLANLFLPKAYCDEIVMNTLTPSIGAINRTDQITKVSTKNLTNFPIENSPVMFTGLKVRSRIEARKIISQGSAIHPIVKFNQTNTGVKPSTLLFTALQGFVASNIYAPIFKTMDNGKNRLIYGGWEGHTSVGPNGNTDEIFMMDVPNGDLAFINSSNWNPIAPEANRKRIVYSDYETDPTLYHTNDPTLLKFGYCSYRLYFEMESLNSDYITNQNLKAPFSPTQFTKLAKGNAGYASMGIYYAETKDCGLTWNGGGSKSGSVNRSHGINIVGFNREDYFKYQFGWPVVIQSGNEYLMYFTAGACPGRQKGISWDDLNKNQKNCVPNVPIDSTYRFGAHSVLMAKGTDGINFTYQGIVKNPDGTNLWGIDDIQYIANSRNWLTIGAGPVIDWNTGNRFNGSSQPGYIWSKAMGYIHPNDPLNIKYQTPENDNHQLITRKEIPMNSSAVSSISFLPSPFDLNRSPISVRIAKDVNDNFLGFLYGEWQNTNALESYIAGSIIQRRIRIRGVDSATKTEVVADYNTSIGPGTAIVSVGRNNSNPTWVNHLGSIKGNKIFGRIEVFDYDGQLICFRQNVEISPGDVWNINCH